MAKQTVKQTVKEATTVQLDWAAEYQIISTGKSEMMPLGVEYTVSGQDAEILVNGGNAIMKA